MNFTRDPKTSKQFRPYKGILFWQPKYDLLKILNSSSSGQTILILLNYSIWIYFFYLSYMLIRHDANIFWQLLAATVIAESIEKYGKSKNYWCRPMYTRHDPTPKGLVDSWYKTGSFPSGHTMKAAYFFLFIFLYNVHSPLVFLSVVIPLLVFRVLVGFHYPVDMVGGFLSGVIIWFLTKGISFPPEFTDFIRAIFNFVFFIN